MASITDEEWGELTPESFETAALLRSVDAVDELRSDLNDGKEMNGVGEWGRSGGLSANPLSN
jgi:hypothetical protein